MSLNKVLSLSSYRFSTVLVIFAYSSLLDFVIKKSVALVSAASLRSDVCYGGDSTNTCSPSKSLRAKPWSVGCHIELPAPGGRHWRGTLGGAPICDRERIGDITLLHLSQKPITLSGFPVLLKCCLVFSVFFPLLLCRGARE